MSREDFEDSFDSPESEDEDEELNEEEDEESAEDEADENNEEVSETLHDKINGDNEEEEFDSEDDEDNEEMVSENGNLDENDDEVGISNYNSNKQKSKASAVKNQISIFDSFLETRIKMQQLLVNINRLPQKETYQAVKNSDSALMKKLFSESFSDLRKLSKILLEIDSYIHHDHEEDGNKRKAFNFDDESLSKRFCSMKDNYPEIIDKWYEQTKFVRANVNMKKFDSFETCPSKMIEQTLTNKDRLIRRTHQKRSEYKIIGASQQVDDYDEEVYDDDDFYHQLLRQIIENKTGESENSLSLYKKYSEIQRMRSKMKKKVDTRASKGRKIRYDVHEKLVNFMAPINRNTMLDDAKDVLFKSLFGNFKVE